MFRVIINNFMENAASEDMAIWVPAIISVLSLVVNIIFSTYIAPRVIEKNNYKNKLLEITGEFLGFLSEVISMNDFNGIPTKVRNYSLRIHMLFETGTAPDEIASILERLFTLVKERKNADDHFDVAQWEVNMRDESRKLRAQIAKYSGRFK